MKTLNTNNQDKINVEDLIKDFKVTNIDNFKIYLKDIWKDLAQRSEDQSKGINKITFAKYYDLPGIISDRLFKLFDREKKNYLGYEEFIEGMLTLFSESYEKLIKFVFDFYDFEKLGKITREDMRVVLSYIPLSKEYKKRTKLVKHDFKDRIESQDEIFNLLERTFETNSFLDFAAFQHTIENKCSDPFLFILIFLLERKPFKNKQLNEYSTKNKNSTPNLISKKKYIASPSLNSKFSPSIIISKSPFMTKKKANPNTKNVLLQYLKKDVGSKNNLQAKPDEETKGARSMSTLIRKVTRKQKISLKNIEVEDKQANSKGLTVFNFNNYDLMPAAKYTPTNKLFVNPLTYENSDIKTNLNNSNLNNSNSGIIATSESIDVEEEEKFEGFLYKISEKRQLKKSYYKLLNKDLYCKIDFKKDYKNKEDTDVRGIHNLSGVFVKEEQSIKYDKLLLYGFSILFPFQIRTYYADNEHDYKAWMQKIQKITGSSNLNSIYDLKDKIGNGQFGVVRLGIEKETGKKVAIKILQKSRMTVRDLEMVRTEIEILKICQHPFIINLYDIFENYMFIYIVMEYCSGGDLFSYLENNDFRIPEAQAASIIHMLSTAIFYLHSYGIAHRDIKPENILLTDTTPNFSIRLLDFGLSKITGPNEVCEEPFGTLSYVAPEVLLKQPYNKKVDIWSIGILTYLLLTGFLPYDDESSEKVFNMTIQNPVPYPPVLWNKISKEARLLVDNLLQKDHNKRMTIKEVLEHIWIQKYCKSKVTEMRRHSDMGICDFKLFSSTSI